MGRRFRGQEQPVPEQVRSWADPLILQYVELAQRLDLSGFEQDYRADGVGGVPYQPSLMLVTVWWCYHRQRRSPEEMARMCREQASLRVIWQRERVPSAAALRRFVQGHQAAWQQVADSLLGVCDQAGLVDVSVTATDSTPTAAPAALSKTLSAQRITVLADEVSQQLTALRTRLQQMADNDIRGFVEHGCGDLIRTEQLLLIRLDRLRRAEQVARGRRDQTPTTRNICPTVRWQARVERHTTELAAMIAEKQQKHDAYQAKVAAGQTPRGPAPHPAEHHPAIREKTASLHRAQARLATARTNPAPARAGPAPRANITDPDSRILKGKNTTTWVLGRLLTLTVITGQLIIAALLSPAGNDAPGLLPNLHNATANCRRAGITQPFGHHLADSGFACPATMTANPPIDGTLLVSVTNEHDQTHHHDNPTLTSTARHTMTERMATDENRALYARRTPMIEPVFAHLLRTDRHLHSRGDHAQHCEILALTTAYNVTKYLKTHPRPTHPPGT